MFHSKQDVDRHVNEVFRNIKSEYQRNLKCYQIAKLYYKFKDYKSAIKYLNRYILTTTNSAAAHRLLGECYLGVNLKVKALDSFKSSLVLNGSQHELVLKICTLLMDPEVSSATPRATYWLERAESLFPANPVVFQLREHLLKSNLDGKQDNGQLEKLILSEISARPTDVTVRIRLLNFFMDTKRYKIAYQHALEIEERTTFSNDLRWYECLCNVVQAYEKENNDVDFIFFVKKLHFFERRADLFLQEFPEEVKTMPESSSAVFAFDQCLHSVSKIEVPPDQGNFFSEYMNHMKAQLSFHLATLALKRAKRDYGIWPKAFRTASPLLLQATQNTMNLKASWYVAWVGRNKLAKEVKQWNNAAALRISQAGHVLLAWMQNKEPSFLEKVSQFCGGKWRSNVYNEIFYNREHQQATETSHFINDRFFSNVPLRVLSKDDLRNFDQVSQTVYPDSLHHLVWLGLSYCNWNGQLSHEFRCMIVPDLQFTVENLSQCGPESLNQLDVDAFLYASVMCAKSVTSTVVNVDRPNRLPINISDELCSVAQADWWVAVYKTYKNQVTGNIADMRLKLRKGIECIRASGQHGLHVKVIVMLAKLFQERAAKNKNSGELSGLEERAHLYWTAAIPLLEKMERSQQIREVPNRLFDYRGKDLTQQEIKAYLEEGKLFLACRLMKQGRDEQAIEAFQALKSPYATFYQAMIYEKLASEEVNLRPESITSENRSQHIILLTRARDALYLTLDRLRSPAVEPNHPLNGQLQDHLEQIEKQLAMIDPDSTLNRNGDSQSDETDTAPGPLSPEVDENLDASFNVYNTSNFLSAKNHSMSRVLKQNFSDRHHGARFEARPSPERLDAQLRHLVQTNSYGLQAIVEQLKEMKSSMQIELKDLGCVTRDLLAEMKRWNDRHESMSRRTADVLKPEDLFELREEDYEDLSQLSQQYTPYQNYQINRPMTGIQGTSTATYGTPVPSPVSHVPPVVPTSENPLIPTSFYPGAHPSPSLDPSLLLYQTLGYYAPGIPYSENQNLPDYRGQGMQKGVPFTKNVYKAPDSVPTTAVFTTKPQPPNVVITSSDMLPAFTSAGTPAMSVTIPPQHIRGLAPSVIAQKPSPGHVHPYQIQMPPQAQLVKESPTEKLNSMVPTSSLSTSPIQATLVSGVKPTAVLQSTPKVVTQTNKMFQEQKVLPEGNKLFESPGKLSVFDDKDWKDRGIVLVKIMQDKLGKVRIIMFQEQDFAVYADHYITPEMALEPLPDSENAWVWATGNNMHKSDVKPSELVEAKSNWQKFRVQFSTLDEAKDFEFAFNKGRKSNKGPNQNGVQKTTIPAKSTDEVKSRETCNAPVKGNTEKCFPCESKEKSTDKTSLGGFTFASSPIVKPPVLKVTEQKEKPKEAPKATPFAEFTFSTPTTTPSKPADLQTKTTRQLFDNVPDTSGGGSTNLFAGVAADPNAFKKDPNFTFGGSNALVFGHLNKQKPADGKPIKSKADKTDEENDGDDEFEPTAEFKPVVDLPELVDLKTGEENDKILFDERAKLLRFITESKEWKERGVGQMKVLLNDESGKVRLIMRRELVLKVCCNHYLNENLEFKRMTKSEKALTWYAQDYSEGDLKTELFALRFATPDSMLRFEKVIKETQSKMKNGRMEGTQIKQKSEEKTKDLKPLSELFKPKAGSWECDTCLLRNSAGATKCVSCETPKPGSGTAVTVQATSTAEPKGLGKGITLPPNTFTFGIPLTTTTTSASSSTPGFSFTASPAGSSVAPLTTSRDSTGLVKETALPPTKFTFGIPPSTAATTTTTTATLSVSGSLSTFSFNPQGTSFNPNPSTTSSSFAWTSLSPGKNTTAPLNSMPQMSLWSSGTATTSAAVVGSTPPTQFSFGRVQTPTTTSAGDATFTFPSLTVSTPKGEDKSFAFHIPKGEEKTNSMFLFQNQKEKFEFSMTTKSVTSSPSPKGKAAGEADTSEDYDEGAEEDNGDDIIVKPIVPLPDKVPPHTGEEEEDVLYETRAKLYRFTDKEWKERGIGDVKILKHKTTNKIRLLMRREVILKVCLNHYLTPDIEFTQKNEKAWHWTAPDFSDGEVQTYVFAIRFKTAETANEFKKALDDALNKAVPFLPKSEKAEERTEAMRNFTFAVPTAPNSEAFTGAQSPDDDVVVVYENKVTPEQREKAESLHLPPNFYAYLQAPDCPGCRGCDTDDGSQECGPPDSTTTSATKFEHSPWGTLNFGKDDFSQKVLFSFAGNQAPAKRKLAPEGPIKAEQPADNNETEYDEDDVDEEKEDEYENEDDEDDDDEDEDENEEQDEDEDEEEDDDEDDDENDDDEEKDEAEQAEDYQE